jgi:hypothetical protein
MYDVQQTGDADMALPYPWRRVVREEEARGRRRKEINPKSRQGARHEVRSYVFRNYICKVASRGELHSY